MCHSSASDSTRIVVVPHGSPLYDAMVELRREVLRRPLGLDLSAEQLADEGSLVHLAALDGSQTVVGTLLLDVKRGSESAARGMGPGLDETVAWMRQVAVRRDQQGAGVGRALVERGEQEAAARGARVMMLHSREAVVAFYERLGYVAEGETYVEVTLPHRTMRKALGAGSG